MNAQNKATKVTGNPNGAIVRTLNKDELLPVPELTLEEQAQQIQKQKDALQEQENELELKMQQAAEQEQNRKLDEYTNLREDANGFRATAAKEEIGRAHV